MPTYTIPLISRNKPAVLQTPTRDLSSSFHTLRFPQYQCRQPHQPITSFRPVLVIHHRVICLFTPGLSGGKSVIIQPLLIRANINLLNKSLLNDTLHFSHKFS